ncbi:hypothetical protein GCM10011391_25280 [Pullulanibacillus camelliae]|uniref:Uncharacterized protein n=1 Tax=Pullulanibacillus camelliae TaxID=1707096 RepID=A0A8J2YIT9_9BACL|nr:hypothetical protein GCM10011391_25280 [Pullulanibacillus camelliae]
MNRAEGRYFLKAGFPNKGMLSHGKISKASKNNFECFTHSSHPKVYVYQGSYEVKN